MSELDIKHLIVSLIILTCVVLSMVFDRLPEPTNEREDMKDE